MTDKVEKKPFGPLTKEAYDAAFWKNIKDKIYHLNNTNEEETIPDCRDFLRFLVELNASTNVWDYFPDTTIRNYFFNEFFILNAKNLIATKTFNNPEMLELSNRCLEETVFLWAKLLDDDNAKITETAKVILDPARSYFKMNNQEDLPPAVVPSFLTAPTEEHLNWIKELKEGDLVDCIKQDSQYKKMAWCHGKIGFVMDSHLKVLFLCDKETGHRYVDKVHNANEIAPYKTRCHDHEWRLKLSVGDEIDTCDTSHVWYTSTILEVREQGETDKFYKEIKIGYRTYSEDGDKEDSEGRKFFGWSARYDEWFVVTSPRLAPKRSMAKKLFMGSSSNTDDPVIDDSNDPIYRQEGKKIYAITRNPHCKSIWMVNLVNTLGERGIFDRILKRISDTENWAPIEVVSLIVLMFGNLHAIFHRDFCVEYIPKLKDAVWKNVLKSPDSNIRNFTKERLDNIILSFDFLLKRIYSIPEKNELCENLNLEICSICFESNFLERKLQGLKTLLDFIKNIKLGTTKFINNEVLNKFIETHQIFDKIFGSKGHVGLIQRSADFLKYMANESSLAVDDLELVWNAAVKGDKETQLSILKVLNDIALNFKNEHLDFFIKKISEIPSSDIIPEQIELSYELTRYSLKTSPFNKKVREFYWAIITDDKCRYSTEIVELTLNKFCDNLKNWELKEERQEILNNCVENIKNGVSVLASIKILRKTIDHFPTAAAANEKITKSMAIETLCKEKDLLTVLISDLISFKSKVKKRLHEGKEINEAYLDSIVGERTSYTAHINERLHFIHFTLSNAESKEITLSYDYLSNIWDNVVNGAMISTERDVVYKWIKETAESRSGFPMAIEDLLKFYKNKMNNQEDCKNMTLEGFNCFKNVFLVINEKLTKINKTTTVTQYQSNSNYMYSAYEETKTTTENEYKLTVVPGELEGIQSIWNFILTAENEAVVEKAIDFLNKLYISLDEELESKIVSIREEFLTTCIKNLQDVLKQKSFLKETAFTNGTLRCLSLVRSLLDETEKKGIGNLKSHSGLVKGELLTFNITNDITSGSDVPKKSEIRLHSNLTVFELRCEIGKLFKCTWDQVKLLRGLSQKEVKDNENGKTLGEIRIRNGETLATAKRPTPSIPQAPLVFPDGTLNPLAKKVFEDWFNTFSENGKMNPEGCANFIHSCTNDHCKAEDKRVKDVFTQYDTDKDGFLNIENFIEFYGGAAKLRPHVVWNNISAHHYRNDLKKASEVEAEKVEISTLARYILSNNRTYFSLIFSLLDFGGKIAIEAWKLINSLPTSQEIFSDIVSLKGIREAQNKDWENILNSQSAYKLLYSLTVIEYLMEDEDEGDETSSHLWTSNTKLLEYKKTWRADFIVYGGFDHLFKIFNNFAKNSQSSSIFEKNIISFILKIMKNYLTATFASTVPHLYRYLSFVRLFHLSLDFINDYLSGDISKALAQDEKLPEVPLTKKASSTAQIGVSDEIAAAAIMYEGPNLPNVSLNKQSSKADNKNEKEKETQKKEKYKIEETEEFRSLVERLKGDLGTHIIKTLDLKNFIELITKLSNDILSISGDLESEDRMILEFSLSILVSILVYDKENIVFFFNPENKAEFHQDAAKYILDGIFCSKSINVRRYFQHALYVLTKETATFKNAFPAKYLIGLFLKNLPSSQDETKKDCVQLFELLCRLIEETYSNSCADDKDALNFEELIILTVNQIKSHQSTEKRNNLHQNDKILMGLLQLCEKLLNVKPNLRDVVGAREKHNFVEYIFSICLFDLNEREGNMPDLKDDQDANSSSKDYVKAKSRDSRAAAYKLLATLCRDSPTNANILIANLNNLMGVLLKMNNVTTWGYSPAGDTKSFYGYLGIKNLGCICYMIAMLQQFFMTPTFRYGILMSDDKKEPNWVKKDNKWTIDDNVVHQLQQMFGFLELSDRQDYNPFEFCFAFKDFSGNPVNVSVQQDTQEFLNMIFDKLEFGLKHTPFRHITDSVYGGRTSGQFICQSCGSIKERIEGFFALSLEVRNMKTIYDSLDKYITGELIEDYYCEACKKKTDINKRTCIETLPNVLIVHLQRIIFDLDTLMNQKINSRLEFPTDLNVEPYTKEGLEWRDKVKNKNKKKAQADDQGSKGDVEGKGEEERAETTEGNKEEQKPIEEELGPYKLHDKEYYEYKLAGVVVHVGTADFGHYYSYINTNRGDPSKRDKSKPDKWLEYNDSNVRDFDVKNLESECFGGASQESGDDAWSWVKVGRENSKNAYILVYEKVVKNPLKLVVQNKDDEAYLEKALNVSALQTADPKSVQIVEQEIGEGDSKQTIQNYMINYYDLKKFVPSRVYKRVWEDNHKFMFERHIYNEEFFKFIKETCNSLKLPAMPQNIIGPINPEHKNLSQDQKKNISQLIQTVSLLVYYMLARAHDNNTINDLSHCLRTLLSLAPESAWTFFEAIVLKDFKNAIDLLLVCPDKTVRYFSSQLILFSINVMINYYNFELDLAKLKEREENINNLSDEEKHLLNIESNIARYLSILISLMPSDVAKNWTRFYQYFEFWRDFAYSGDTQFKFLVQKDFIAVLADFFLEKKSPIELCEKKHSMGNRYTDPEFTPLLQTLSLMVRRSKIVGQSGIAPPGNLAQSGVLVFPLTEFDTKCLYSIDLYERAVREKYDPQAVGVIIQQVCFENEGFSEPIAVMLLKGLNKANFDDAKSYLEAITYFISIPDFLQFKRIEWILGHPQPLLTTTRENLDSWGLYGNNSLDDLVVYYESPLYIDGSTSLINLMLQNRKRLENLCIVCLKQLLILADVNANVLEYIIALPAPSYNYAKFTDWFLPFIEYFLAEAKRFYYSSFPKEEFALETLKIYKSVDEKIQKRLLINKAFMETQTQQKSEPTEAEKKVLPHFFPPYIIGRTAREDEVSSQVFSAPEDPNIVKLVTTDVFCHVTESKPTGDGNLAFPSAVQADNRLITHEIKHGSKISNFIKSSAAPIETRAVPVMDPKNTRYISGQADESDHDDIQPLLDDDDDAQRMAAMGEEGNGDGNGFFIEGAIAPVDGSETEGDSKGSHHNDELVAEESDQQKPTASTQPTEQVSQQEENKQEGEIEEKKDDELDAGFNCDVKPVIRRFIFFNESQFHLSVTLQIIAKQGGFVNFKVPNTAFRVVVKPKTPFCLLGITKLINGLDWGEYETKVNVQVIDNVPVMVGGGDSNKKKNNPSFQIRDVSRLLNYTDASVGNDLFD